MLEITLASVASFASFLFTWKVYYHFISLADAVHESNFSYWVKRFTTSIFVAFVTFFIVMAFFVKDELIPVETQQNGLSERSESTGKSLGNDLPSQTGQIPSISNELKSPSVDSKLGHNLERSDTPERVQSDAVTRAVDAEQPDKRQAKKACDYEGNDPIVRERLGCD